MDGGNAAAAAVSPDVSANATVASAGDMTKAKKASTSLFKSEISF